MYSQKEINILMKRIAEIYKMVYGNALVKVMLYGSYARGTQDSESDIDILSQYRTRREMYS